MSKHTPEPWKVAAAVYGGFTVESKTGEIIGQEDDGACDDPDCCGERSYAASLSEPDAQRIVSCVNALAGIERPEEWIKAVRDLLAKLHVASEADRDNGLPARWYMSELVAISKAEAAG